MTREDAVHRLAELELGKLTPEERAEQLGYMLHEAWEDHPDWSRLPDGVRAEFEDGELQASAADPRYDPVLLLWLRGRYSAVTNSYIRERLATHGIEVESIEGSPATIEACPCCGYRTIASRNSYNICEVCWWEDDGQDNQDADEVMGGPNYELSLTQARVNFLVHGISDPERHDLRQFQDPPGKYERGRTFALSADRAIVMEPDTAWTSSAFQL